MTKKTAKKSSKKAVPKAESPQTVDDLVDAIVEDAGPENAQVLGSDVHAARIRGVISTQSGPLDRALGRGGVPLGRITIVHGKEGSGKTTLCLHLVAEVQKMGGLCFYFDKEYKLDPDYAQSIGVNTKRLIISQPSTLETIYEAMVSAVSRVKEWRIKTKKRTPVLIVLDSINACITKAQLEGSFDQKHYAPQAAVHSQGIPKVLELLAKEDVALVFIAQNRTQIGKAFGDPDDISGGNAVRYYASVIMKVTRIKNSEDKLSQLTRVDVRKNQIAPPFKRAEFWIRHGVGIDPMADLIQTALDLNVIGRAKNTKTGKEGSWYEFPVGSGKRFANGLGGVREVLSEDEELKMDIMAAVQAVGKAPAQSDEDTDAT